MTTGGGQARGEVGVLARERGGDRRAGDRRAGDRRGDDAERRAFEEMVAEHGASVLTFLRRRCGACGAAEDAWQETFLRAWRGRGTYDAARGEVRVWLLGIAGRCAADVLRGERGAARSGDENVRREPAAEGGAHAAGTGETGAATGEVWALADRVLSADAASALWLRYGEGLTPSQIGVVLGWSGVRVRVMLLRSRRVLRAALHAARADAGAGEVAGKNRAAVDGAARVGVVGGRA